MKSKIRQLSLAVAVLLLTVYFFQFALHTNIANKNGLVKPVCELKNRKYSNLNHQVLDKLRRKHIFFAALLHSNEPIIIDWVDQLLKTIQIIGNQNMSNIFVSIHCSGFDSTTQYINNYVKRKLINMNVKFDIQANNNWDSIKTIPTNRIGRLATLRNIALRHLYLSKLHLYDEVVFLNDVVFCASDVIYVLASNVRLQADMSCATDFITSYHDDSKTLQALFYDTWVATDINGMKFSNFPPYARDASSITSWSEGHPFPVLSCWNGLVAIKADVFQAKGLRFRQSRYPMECPASECELLCRDLHVMRRSKIVIVPSAAVAYSSDSFEEIQPLLPMINASDVWNETSIQRCPSSKP